MKNGIDNNGDERFYSFYTIDMPIYRKQLDALKDHLNEFFDLLEYGKHGNLERWVWDTCEGVDHDGYGSFRFEWPAEVMNFLTEDQRQRMQDILNQIVCESDIVCDMSYLYSYQAGDVEIETASDVEAYMDTIINAGYNISKDDAEIVPDHLQDAFDTYYATLKISEEVA
jgi:hypothetical protein